MVDMKLINSLCNCICADYTAATALNDFFVNISVKTFSPTMVLKASGLTYF